MCQLKWYTPLAGGNRVHSYVRACVHSFVRACMHVCVHACMHACVCACMHLFVHVCVCACMCVRACVICHNFCALSYRLLGPRTTKFGTRTVACMMYTNLGACVRACMCVICHNFCALSYTWAQSNKIWHQYCWAV
jgi:hypothetical protein